MYKRILIVDDSIYSREMLKTIIEKHGEYIFVDVGSGKEAIEKILAGRKQGREFNCIFLDLEIRRENSFEILKQIKELKPRGEMVLTGAVSLTDENISKGMSMGVQRFIPKPYKINDISVICRDLGV